MAQLLFRFATPPLRPHEKLLARLLWLANGRPPPLHRERFYALKDRLLARYAEPDGEDVQLIVHHCYGCEGTGNHHWDSGGYSECRRCGGTGVYRRFWVVLKRYRWQEYVFHRPADRLWEEPDRPVTIRGKVEHGQRPGRWPEEAALWLALFCDRGLFWRLLTRNGRPCGWTWLPLLNLRRLADHARSLACAAAPRRCSRCGRRFWDCRGRVVWLVCRRCRTPRYVGTETGGNDDDDDIPF